MRALCRVLAIAVVAAVALVAPAAAQGAGVRSFTRLVDLNTTIGNADMADTLHPNDGGYTKMASLWYSAFSAVVGGGRDWPLFRSGLEPGETAPTWTDAVDASTAVGGYHASLSKMETGPRAETAHGGANAPPGRCRRATSG